ELFEWTDGENIDFGNLEDQYFDRVSTVGASGYPLIGGVLNSMDKKNIDFEFIEVDGTPECMEIFKSIEKGDITGVCIEANVCKGGCIGGPYSAKDKKGLYNRQISVKNYIRSKKKIDNIEKIEIPKNLNFSRFYRDKTFQHKYASDYEIEIILKKMGKYEKKDELNCGGCGYNTCREKAEAVFEGMSEAEHCLPFLRSKAEGFKDIIFENSPNIIMVLDENLKVKEFNPTSEKTFNIRAFDIKTKYINELFDDKDFRKVKETGNSIINHKVSISKYNLVVIENIVYVPKEEIFISIMTNISDDEKNKKELSKVKQETINAAQEVIDNQMRVAQEIASLLGETTADTKVILTKLKKLALQEQGELK
ncbi:MAG: [Fe-Fe] hydrogenase large subunit C-terminal domain-containing protein, partial [Clostridiaceae bacterium]